MLKLFLNDRVKIYFKKSKPSRYIFLHHCSSLAFFSSFVHVSLTNALKRKGEKLSTDDLGIKGTAERLVENSSLEKFEK